jgi:hypothetical protein
MTRLLGLVIIAVLLLVAPAAALPAPLLDGNKPIACGGVDGVAGICVYYPLDYLPER